MPKVPSEPIKSCFKSKPVLFFFIVFKSLWNSPLGKTASIPRILLLIEPYLITLSPPALVAILPPIWQLPFEPSEIGISSPNGSNLSFAS